VFGCVFVFCGVVGVVVFWWGVGGFFFLGLVGFWGGCVFFFFWVGFLVVRFSILLIDGIGPLPP